MTQAPVDLRSWSERAGRACGTCGAEFEGAHPPREEMTATYAAARGLDGAALAPLLDAAELRLLREDWPPFLAMGDESGRTVLARRLAALTSAGREA